MLSIGGAWITTLRELLWWAFALAGASAHWVGVPVGVGLRSARGLPKRRGNLNAVVGVGVVGVVGFFGGALAFVALAQLAADAGTVAATGHQRLLYASFAVPAMTGAFWLAMSLYAGLMGRFTDEHDREWWARATGKWLKFSLLWLGSSTRPMRCASLDSIMARGKRLRNKGCKSGICAKPASSASAVACWVWSPA